MKLAIQAENITYGRFNRKFRELWGRLSIQYWGDAWVESMAYHWQDGFYVFGSNSVRLFNDIVVDFKYTKDFCKTMGFDYDALLSQLGDVDYFYFDLSGVQRNNTNFTDEVVVKAAMGEVVDTLLPHNIDKVVVSFIADTERAPDAHSLMSLAEVRALPVQVDYTTGLYLYDTAPALQYFTTPTYIEVITTEYPPAPALPIETITYEEVAGAQIDIASPKMNAIFGLMAPNTDLLDLTIATPSLQVTELADRIGVAYDEWGEAYTAVYKRYQCVLTFSFGSYWDFSDTENIRLVNLVNWGYLNSNTFATNFSAKTAEAASLVYPEIDPYYGAVWAPTNPPKDVVVYAALISHIETFNPISDIFYVTYYPATVGGFIEFSAAWFLVDKLDDYSNRDLSDIIMMSVSFRYKSKDSGWLGGSLLGRFIEMIFVLVVVTVGIIFAPITGGWSLVAAMVVLGIAVKYTGMSVSGVGFAMFGMKALGVAGIMFGVYDIYNQAVELATAEAVALALSESAIDAGFGATMAAATAEVSMSQIVAQLGVMEAAKLVSSAWSFANLLLPAHVSDTPPRTEEQQAQDLSMYSVDASYDIYDNYMNIYEYE